VRPELDLLHALEHTLEALKRTTDVLRSALDAMEQGKPFSGEMITEYRKQLRGVEIRPPADGGIACIVSACLLFASGDEGGACPGYPGVSRGIRNWGPRRGGC
jgi:hypothetical protein